MNNFKKEFLRLYFIAGKENCDLPLVLEKSLKAGITLFQYREKKGSYEELREMALICQKLCKKYSTPFVINDYWQLALEIGADGVHIGQKDEEIKKVIKECYPKMFIGLSVNNLAEAKKNSPLNEIAYFGVGALFPTQSKEDANLAGIKLLTDIRANNITKPIVGIGGITENNFKEVINAGADGIAVISAITKAKDIRLTIKNLLYEKA